MELFKQFTQILEDFINSIVDKRLAENQRPNVGLPYNQELAAEVLKIIKGNEDIRGAIQGQAVAFDQHSLGQAVLKLLDSGEDNITPVEAAIRQIAKDATSGKYVTEREMEEYCSEFQDEDSVENAISYYLHNSHEVTGIIHEALCPSKLTEILRYNDIVEDIAFEDVINSDRFYTAVVENMAHAIQNSNYLDFPQKVRDIVTDDDTLKEMLRNIVKDHFADNGVFEDRVCEIIRNKL